MEVLKSMCEKVEGKPLKTRSWTELKLRVPAYFANLFSYEKFSQKMTHDQQSTAAWRKFREIAPSKKNGSKTFLRFLQVVAQEAPKALPINVKHGSTNMEALIGETMNLFDTKNVEEKTWTCSVRTQCLFGTNTIHFYGGESRHSARFSEDLMDDPGFL